MTNTTHTRMTPDRRLERSLDDRLLAGVAGGLGVHLGVNPWWIRFAFIILAFFGGLGVVVYAAAWLVIPKSGEREPLVSSWLRKLDTSDGGAIFGAVLIGLAAIIVLTKLTTIPGTLILAAVLFIAGFLLYRGDLLMRGRTDGPFDDGDPGGDPAPPSGPGADATVLPETGTIDTTTASAATDVSHASIDDGAPPPATATVRPPRTPRPPRERSLLGRLTIAAGLIVVASMAMLDLAFARVQIDPVGYIAAGVAVIGAGLVVGAWIGRARWLIVVAVLALPALWFTALWPSGLDFSADDVTFRPASVAEIDSPYQLGFGSLTLDLTDLSADELEAQGSISATMGAGEIIVLLPSDIGAMVNVDIGVGTFQTPFSAIGESNGLGIDETVQLGTNPPVLNLDIEVGAGRVSVEEVITLDGGSNG